MDREVSLRGQCGRSAFGGESAQPGWGRDSEWTRAAYMGKGGQAWALGDTGQRSGPFLGVGMWSPLLRASAP